MANAWSLQWYETDLDSSIIRRSVDDVQRFADINEVANDCDERGWTLTKIGNQYVIIRDYYPAIEVINDRQIQIE